MTGIVSATCLAMASLLTGTHDNQELITLRLQKYFFKTTSCSEL